MEKVVKCGACGQHFMHTTTAKKCPFCKTLYVEFEENVVEEKVKEKKGTTKTQKTSPKIWKGN